MTGRQNIEAALSAGGTGEIPVIVCYEWIYVRDHWDQLTSYPWWYSQAPDVDRQMLWRRDVIDATGQDAVSLPIHHTREEQRDLAIEVRAEDVFRVDRSTGAEERLVRPHWADMRGSRTVDSDGPIDTPDDVDAVLPDMPELDPPRVSEDGRGDLASAILDEYGRDLFPIFPVPSPFWMTYYLWGFEEMMIKSATQPDLVKHACGRYLERGIRSVREAAALGAAGVWMEEGFSDMISPDSFDSLCAPFSRRLVEEARAAGMKSIYYYSGNPAGRLDQIISVGADAVSFEESKKDFAIDVEDVLEQVRGRCAVLGNLDAVGILQDGTEEDLRAEIGRQVDAGRRSGGRFVMSLGSPPTPRTPADRVRLYRDLARELGSL